MQTLLPNSPVGSAVDSWTSIKEVQVYSKEDRERILAGLAASGLTAAAFARIPGNPSRRSLRSWRAQAALVDHVNGHALLLVRVA